MIVTVASFKGGVGKTTTAVHLAAYFEKKKPTLLIDGDPNRSATKWDGRGSLPFKVIDERQAARFARDFEHIIIDTEARPEEDDLKSLAAGCDLLVIPTTPDALALDALFLTIEALSKIEANNYRILLTVAPPRPSRDAEEAMMMLRSRKLPLFKNLINRRVVFQKASLTGVPVYEVKDPKAEIAWNEYQKVGNEIVKVWGGRNG